MYALKKYSGMIWKRRTEICTEEVQLEEKCRNMHLSRSSVVCIGEVQKHALDKYKSMIWRRSKEVCIRYFKILTD